MGWRRMALGVGIALAIACTSENSPGPEHDAGVDASSGGAAMGGTGGTLSGGTGGTLTGGTANGGSGGDDGCLPECFAPTQCVRMCGDVPEDFGCCPCPEGYVDVLTCPDAG